MIIDYTYFKGKLNLPQTGNTEGRTLIDQLIEIYEPEYLKKALGYDLWKAFSDGLNILGSELITNGDFDGDASGWTPLNPGWSYNSGRMDHTVGETGVLLQAGMLDVSKTYRVWFNISGTAGTVGVYFGGQLVATYQAGDGDVTFDSIWFNNDAIIEFHPTGPFNGTIDAVSVKEIIIDQRFLDLLEGKAYEYHGRNNFWNGFQPDDKLTPIANYVYYKYMDERASDNTLVGTATGAVDNNTRVNPVPKMIDAWNSMVEMDRHLWQFLSANRDVYPEWTFWNNGWEWWWRSDLCRRNEVYHLKNSFDL